MKHCKIYDYVVPKWREEGVVGSVHIVPNKHLYD